MHLRLRNLYAFPQTRWAIWIALIVIWTYLLVVPVDWLPPMFRTRGTASPLWTLNKFGHALAYGLLAALVASIPLSSPWRWALWAGLSAHAFITEFVQTLVPTRSGSWPDVAIDHSGLLVGFAIAWLWSRPARTPAMNPEHHPRRENQHADLLRHR